LRVLCVTPVDKQWTKTQPLCDEWDMAPSSHEDQEAATDWTHQNRPFIVPPESEGSHRTPQRVSPAVRGVFWKASKLFRGVHERAAGSILARRFNSLSECPVSTLRFPTSASRTRIIIRCEGEIVARVG